MHESGLAAIAIAIGPSISSHLLQFTRANAKASMKKSARQSGIKQEISPLADEGKRRCDCDCHYLQQLQAK